MQKIDQRDIGFFEEVEGVLAKQKPKTLSVAKGGKLKEKKVRVKASKSELQLLNDQPVANPCQGCPYESKVKLIPGAGDLSKAKLLVVTEKVTDNDILNRDLGKSDRYKGFFPLFLEKGFKEEDIYYVALTRCPGSENKEAITHCLNYLRKEILAPNIKCVLLLGVRAMQLLLDKDRTTIFKARGIVFDILGKPCLVTTEKLE
jgi:uracil-DNA glycosylase family 4